MSMTIGFVAIGRTTFDIPFAEKTARDAFSVLDVSSDLDVVGSPDLATEPQEATAAVKSILDTNIEALVVFQATFADSTIISAVAREVGIPLVLWATPEPRTGGRLRLNSFCGINLAAYSLARDGVDYRWVYKRPDKPDVESEVVAAITNSPQVPTGSPPRHKRMSSGLDLRGRTIGLVGTRPDGFDPCDFDAGALQSLFGVSVDSIPISGWFTEADSILADRVDGVLAEMKTTVAGLNDVDQISLKRSIRLYLGLSDLADQRDWNGVATRCWPECFTEFGGAACAGNSMLTSSGRPGCCEADVYGNLTALLLQDAADDPPFVADLIDLDRDTNTAVLWHCGLAPREMAAGRETPHATIHSNRRLPLLYEFPLRAGRVTIARISQSRNEMSLVVGGAEMLDAALSFSGTSGVAALDNSVSETLDTIMGHGLEHHYGVVYGDHRDALLAYAAELGLNVIEL